MVSWKNVIAYAGAFIAFLIGSGFATGQEIMQYFAAYGYWGIAAVGVIFILFLYVGISFITVGYKEQFERPNDVYTYYCGKYVGKFFDYFSVIFIYMSFFVMIAGAGANINQQFGLPTYVGGLILGILAIITVIFGLNSIVDVIGKIGPIIVVLAIGLGAASIIRNPEGLTTVNEVLPSLDILSASSNWLFAAGSYVGFCMLWLAAFMSSMGKGANSKKEAAYGAIGGAAAFSLAVLIVALGLMANIEDVAGSLIPNLVLAEKISPVLALIFSVIVIAGIYTTAVPLLWTAVSKVTPEGTNRFKIAAVVLGGVGIFVGLLIPFDKLINIVYVINGYVGVILLVLMVIKSITVRVKKNKTDINDSIKDDASLL